MKKIKVVVIDDDKEFLDELIEALNSSNFIAIGIDNSLFAVRTILKYLPDIIILDLKMKGKNGYQVAEDLKKIPVTAHIPIIAITGNYKEEEHGILLRVLGIKERLLKPFMPDEIINKIKEYTGTNQ